MKLSRPVILTSILAVACLLIAALVIYSHYQILYSYEKHLPLLKLAENTKSNTTTAHLWFEEMLDGDESINFNQSVQQPLTAAQRHLEQAYNSQVNQFGDFHYLNDEDTKALIKESSIAVAELSASATKLWQSYEAGKSKQNDMPDSLQTDDGSTNHEAIMTADEQQFDKDFDQLQIKLSQLIAKVNGGMLQDQQKVFTIRWLVVTAILLLSSLAVFSFYRLQHKNHKTVNDTHTALQSETRKVSTLRQFIEAVSSGNYNIDLVADETDDSITSTLINMRDTLKKNAEDDRRRNWSTAGMAKIGEILRATNTSSAELYDNIIKFIVKYTNSNQGGLFVLNDTDDGKQVLELVSCYAFERKKYLQKRVDIGDGLVGQCFLEGEKILITDVPQEYISITSGLGGANPNSLLVIPMKVNDQTYGAIEIASFHKYQDYEVDFIEKLAESIASTISNVRVNETTRVLLERTQQQTEEMKSQEEEIRQNMEELEATQEEMRRKQSALERELTQSQQQAAALKIQEQKLTESQDTLQAIVDNIPRAIFWKDNDLRFMGCNIIFAKIAGVTSPRDLIGKTDFDMAWSAQADAYRKDDYDVMRSRKAKLDIEEVNVNSSGEESWVRTSKVPIISQKGDVVAILGMFEDITAYKRKEADVAQKLKEREEALKELKQLRQLLNPTLKG